MFFLKGSWRGPLPRSPRSMNPPPLPVGDWLATEIAISKDEKGTPKNKPWDMRKPLDALFERLTELPVEDPEAAPWMMKGCRVFKDRDRPYGFKVALAAPLAAPLAKKPNLSGYTKTPSTPTFAHSFTFAASASMSGRSCTTRATRAATCLATSRGEGNKRKAKKKENRV